MNATGTVVVAVVGIDGCGKSSAWRGALDALASRFDVVGIGDDVVAGSPGMPLHSRRDVPLCRATRQVTGVAKRTRFDWAYRQLKTLDLIGRSRMRDHVVEDEMPSLLLTDGDPLVNTMAWSLGRLHRDQLASDDELVLETTDYLSGARRIPSARLSYYLRQSLPLVLVNRLGLARFARPDLVVLLSLDGSVAMERIRARGRPLQAHETEAALTALDAGYERICALLESRRGVRIVRIAADRVSREEVARLVAEIGSEVASRPEPLAGDATGAPIEVVATTISGSLKDQRKLGRIGPAFRARTRQPVNVHAVDSHREARDVTRDAVRGGARTVVSAGGAGTFNAVLEGCHLDAGLPSDMRLAFLRKGSADLIGKMLRIPDELGAAVTAIVDGLEHDRCVTADVIAIEASDPRGQTEVRHLIGFGGLGIFGAVPIFTEARWVRLYKGILGTLFGDYGPFYVGLSLATLWWYVQRARGRVPELRLDMDGDVMAPQRWAAVIVVGGDLGRAFPLGQGSHFGNGVFRVVALADRGPLQALRQLAAARSGAILRSPQRYGAIVRDVRVLRVRPVPSSAGRVPVAQPANVDGLAMAAPDSIGFRISGRILLVSGPDTTNSRNEPG